MHKDVRKFVQSLTVIDGVTCAVNGGGHIKIMKDGKTVATMPHTPGDHRWRNNILRDLRSVGITPSTVVTSAASTRISNAGRS